MSLAGLEHVSFFLVTYSWSDLQKITIHISEYIQHFTTIHIPSTKSPSLTVTSYEKKTTTWLQSRASCLFWPAVTARQLLCRWTPSSFDCCALANWHGPFAWSPWIAPLGRSMPCLGHVLVVGDWLNPVPIRIHLLSLVNSAHVLSKKGTAGEALRVDSWVEAQNW